MNGALSNDGTLAQLPVGIDRRYSAEKGYEGFEEYWATLMLMLS